MDPESLKPGDLVSFFNKVLLFLRSAESFRYSFLYEGRIETVSNDFVRNYLKPLDGENGSQ